MAVDERLEETLNLLLRWIRQHALLYNTIQYKFISISAKYNAFGYIQYKAI